MPTLDDSDGRRTVGTTRPGLADVVTPRRRPPHRSGWRTDALLLLVDGGLVVLAYLTALAVRHAGHVPAEAVLPAVVFTACAVAVHVVVQARLGLYGRVWLQAGASEVWSLVVATGIAVAVLVSVDLVVVAGDRLVPLSVPFNGGALALLLLAAVRFQSRVRAQHSGPTNPGTRVLLVGPLSAARAVVEQMRLEPAAGLEPVAVVTDQPTTWGRFLSGVPVVGPVEDLAELAGRYAAEQVLLLPDSLPGGQVSRIADLAQAAGLRSRSLPTLHQSVGQRARLGSIRDLSLEDLLGRDQVQVDEAAIGVLLAGKRVLVTGAGGSIGSEIAVQVSRYGPELLVLLDHDETHLHDAVARLEGPARSALGDIRDEVFVRRVMLDARPDVVFHAAAHKHVPVLEDHPSEAVRTNVHGTDVVARAALRAGVTRFIGISTDKAVDPSCVMGATKRIAEQIVVHLDGPRRHYCAVRFGNVLGSRGSVVPTFVRQVEAGGPVTVTHPDVTRFFMTTHEAVALVFQAAATAHGGEVFMLDMGEPVRIVDLAERIIGLAGLRPGVDVAVVFSGLRPGEKLNERLSADSESVHATGHPKVARVRSSLCDPQLLERGVAELVRRSWSDDEEGTRRLLWELARLPGHLDLDGEVVPIARQARVAPLPAPLPVPRTGAAAASR